MAYIRKTRDVWSVEQNFGGIHGWECVSECDTWPEARAERKVYRENQPEYPVRIRPRRERIEPVAASKGGA